MPEKSSFNRVTAPGLPPWPGLYLDASQQRAVVSFRLATWRSWARACWLTKIAAWIINLLAATYLWQWLNFIPNPLARGFLAFVGWGISATITKPLFPAAFAGFLARQMFATRSTFWFTPQAIACRSPLYENHVLLERHWHGHPVQIRFDITLDTDAQQQASLSAETPHRLRRQYQSAQLLRLIISTHDPHRTIQTVSNGSLMRSIPLSEIDARDAAPVATVLTAATALTARMPKVQTPQTAGIDIDVISN